MPQLFKKLNTTLFSIEPTILNIFSVIFYVSLILFLAVDLYIALQFNSLPAYGAAGDDLGIIVLISGFFMFLEIPWMMISAFTVILSYLVRAWNMRKAPQLFSYWHHIAFGLSLCVFVYLFIHFVF